MSFISSLFGGPKTSPTAPPPPPNIGDAAGYADARAARYRKRKGTGESILAGSGLGDVGKASAAPAQATRSTLG